MISLFRNGDSVRNVDSKKMIMIHRWRTVLNRSSPSIRFNSNPTRPLCSSSGSKKPAAADDGASSTNSKKPSAAEYGSSSTNSKNPAAADDGGGSSINGNSSPPPLSTYEGQYKALQNLDFMTASQILFTEPARKRKKFGWDFHVVQFFIACLPSLAVYLVAQYARKEMRRMDAELEKKKQAEFEAQAKELQRKQNKAMDSSPQLLEVKERLNKLEEIVKEIAVDSKQQPHSSTSGHEIADVEKGSAQVAPKKIQQESSVKTSTENQTDSTEGKTRESDSVAHASTDN